MPREIQKRLYRFKMEKNKIGKNRQCFSRQRTRFALVKSTRQRFTRRGFGRRPFYAVTGPFLYLVSVQRARLPLAFWTGTPAYNRGTRGNIRGAPKRQKRHGVGHAPRPKPFVTVGDNVTGVQRGGGSVERCSGFFVTNFRWASSKPKTQSTVRKSVPAFRGGEVV